jgi:hypothetical protein
MTPPGRFGVAETLGVGNESQKAKTQLEMYSEREASSFAKRPPRSP